MLADLRQALVPWHADKENTVTTLCSNCSRPLSECPTCRNDTWCDYCRRCELGCRPMADFCVAATWAEDAAKGLVLCRSDCDNGGWSLYGPGTSDKDIADGTAAPLICGGAKWIESIGWSRPNEADYAQALAILAGED